MEIFLNFFGFLTTMTLKKISSFTRIELLYYVAERCFIDEILESIKEHRYKLLYILLNHDIY